MAPNGSSSIHQTCQDSELEIEQWRSKVIKKRLVGKGCRKYGSSTPYRCFDCGNAFHNSLELRVHLFGSKDYENHRILQLTSKSSLIIKSESDLFQDDFILGFLLNAKTSES